MSFFDDELEKIGAERYFDDSGFRNVNCPECGKPMELVWSEKFRYASGRRKPFYRCVDHPECRGTHGAHPNGAPMGFPADTETRALRKQAHKELNRLFPLVIRRGREIGHKERSDRIYSWLRFKGYGHISKMGSDRCQKLIDELKKIKSVL